jgi:Uma2 family endonuclease
MASVLPTTASSDVHYPDSDGRPMGETNRHVQNLSYLVIMLETHFAEEPQIFIAGNMFVYYVRGDRHRHVSPDVFAVRGIPRQGNPERRRYLVWEEGKSPDAIIELTSESAREEDLDDKMHIYQDKLRVPEYFLFDPFHEYLDPPLQGHRLVDGLYQRIEAVDGRLPSQVLGLHLEDDGPLLRLYDPVTRSWLPTPPEEHEERLRAKAALADAEAARREAELARHQAETKSERLQRELDELRSRLNGASPSS